MSEQIHKKHPEHKAAVGARWGAQSAAAAGSLADLGVAAAGSGVAGLGGGVSGGSTAAVVECLGHYAETAAGATSGGSADESSAAAVNGSAAQIDLAQKGDVKDVKSTVYLDKDETKRKKEGPTKALIKSIPGVTPIPSSVLDSTG